MVWYVPDGMKLSWRQFGDETVIFNPASGQTHLLDAFSAWVLRELETSPSSRDVLADRLVREAGLEADLAVRRLQEVLEKFHTQGLAESDQEPD